MKRNHTVQFAKIALLVLLVNGIGIIMQAQKVPSSCNAPDSIIKKFYTDAQCLALRKIQRRSLSYQDSVLIPMIHSDSILDALIAVYNATALPARDTVIDICKIHTLPIPGMHKILIAANPNLGWMKKFKGNQTPTGNAQIDTILSRYQLEVKSYLDPIFMNDDLVTLSSKMNVNIAALIKIFEAISGVAYAEQGGFAGDGNNVTDSIYADFIQLTYSKGWGDCQAGCINRRYWEFKVYPNCSVEFVRSYGDQMLTDVNGPKRLDNFQLRPNPFTETISLTIKHLGPVQIEVFSIQGKRMVQPFLKVENGVYNLSLDGTKWPSGIYLIKVMTEQEIITQRIFKE